MKLRQRFQPLSKLKPWMVSGLRSRSRGFTLIELLIVIGIAGLIVSALMGLVIELIGTEQRESSRTETQRSMQLALNYIASDLRQAVHIYGDFAHPQNDQSRPSYLEYLPPEFSNDDDYRPVVAFWKPKPIDLEAAGGVPDFDDCATVFAGNDQQRLLRECSNLWKQRRAYSLVVYFQVKHEIDNDDGIWQGESRIVRYELPKFDNLNAGSAAAAFARTPGFVDPAELAANPFAAWPFSGDDNCQDDPCVDGLAAAGEPRLADFRPQVLVDFVDNPDAPIEGDRENEPQDCSDLGANINGDPDDVRNRYDRVPDAGSTRPSNSFFICLRNVAGAAGEAQDVAVYLRGNASAANDRRDSFLPTLQTRITLRGAIDRDLATTEAAP